MQDPKGNNKHTIITESTHAFLVLLLLTLNIISKTLTPLTHFSQMLPFYTKNEWPPFCRMLHGDIFLFLKISK